MDFNPYAARKERQTKVVSDERAQAQYYNNIGAEHFADGDLPGALPYFRKAVEMAPKLSFAWSNLGVALSRSGREEEAERAYLKAIELNKREYTAMANIAKLYQRQGRQKEADRYESKIESFREKNPYFHYYLGEQAYNIGNYQKSIKHFKEAIRRKGKEHEFHLRAGQDLCPIGKTKQGQVQSPQSEGLCPRYVRPKPLQPEAGHPESHGLSRFPIPI